jgi:hypothetical protein
VSAASQSRTQASGAAIAAVATIGYTGYLAGPPLIGFVAQLATVRVAPGLVVVTSLVIAALAPRVEPRPRGSADKG